MVLEIKIAAAVFMVGYLMNIFYITVLYHRGLAHGAVVLSPMARFLVQHTGNWVTGIDPKGWACMHRLHHLHSDTAKDPHSPVFQGIWGVWVGQLKSYKRVLRKLMTRDPELISLSQDIDFDVHFLNRKGLWFVPYVVHASMALMLAWLVSSPLIGLAYFLGIMSHPLQGWLVNSFAHKVGYRNFNSADNSRNNAIVSLLVFGEGLQNNHHQFPASAKFSVKWFEVDLGYLLCVLASKIRVIRLKSKK